MVDKLIIEDIFSGSNIMDTKKITGFHEGELQKLKSLKNEDARKKLLTILDERNNGIATCWHNGYGIYGLWFDNEAAYLNIGKTCD